MDLQAAIRWRECFMISIAVCDDTHQHLESLCAQVEGYFSSHGSPEHEILSYSSPDALIQDLENGRRCDIAILDIIMPGKSGTDTARRIREIDEDARIIFASVSREYAIEAYSIGAVHYIPKPVEPEALEEALDRAISFKHPKPERRIVLYMKNAIIQSVECNDILYIESLGYRRIVHTRQGVFEETKQTLSTLLEELECLCPGQFCSPYRGYIINLNEISTITPSHIVMRDGFKVLMKRGDYRRIRDIYFAWTFSPFHE